MENNNKGKSTNEFAGVVYFLTVIGAAIFNIQHAATFWLGILGFLKALVWPIFVMYKVLDAKNVEIQGWVFDGQTDNCIAGLW